MLRRTVACLGLITALFFASNAQAQFSQYLLPIERGVLESHIEAQYQYSKIDLGPADLNVGLISIEGQYNFGSFEVGINIPFVTGWITNVGDSWQLGDIMASVKAKVFGISDIFGLAVFGNFYLPTHSGDFTHSFFRMQLGAAVSAKLLGFEVGGGIETIGTIIGDDRDDTWLVGFYGFARVPILGLIAVQAAVEYYNSLHPSGDLNALFVTPGVEVRVMGIHAGIGSRIAITDDAKYFGLGRASLLVNAGYSW